MTTLYTVFKFLQIVGAIIWIGTVYRQFMPR